jgi:hypothetical protein
MFLFQRVAYKTMIAFEEAKNYEVIAFFSVSSAGCSGPEARKVFRPTQSYSAFSNCRAWLEAPSAPSCVKFSALGDNVD